MMQLFLAVMMDRLKVDELTLFRIAHVWAFGTDPKLDEEVNRYKKNSIIPKYVVEYLKSLQ